MTLNTTDNKTFTIPQFCAVYTACDAGTKWALKTCDTMYDVWDLAPVKYLQWVATRASVMSSINRRLFFAAAARWRISCLTEASTDYERDVVRRIHEVIAAIEDFARGVVGFDRLEQACKASYAITSELSAYGQDDVQRKHSQFRWAAARAIGIARLGTCRDEQLRRKMALVFFEDEDVAWLRKNVEPCFEVDMLYPHF